MPKASAVVLVSAFLASLMLLLFLLLSGVPAVARIPAVAAILTAVDVPSAICVSNVSASRRFLISDVVGFFHIQVYTLHGI